MLNFAKFGLVVLSFCGSALHATGNDEDKQMSQTTLTVANTYYAAFNGKNSVTDVPMQEDLTFVSPRFTLTSADAFRGALTELFKRVKRLEISDQVHEGNTVLTFYDLDLGMPDGPIPMAERLQVKDGYLAHVELIFDSARLPTTKQ